MNWLQNLIVGVLFFGAIAILGYFTVLSDAGPFAKKGTYYVVFFNNAEGVKPGTKVTLLGVHKGRVASVDLVDASASGQALLPGSPGITGQRVAITCELDEPIQFYENYSIGLKNESILSGKVVAFDPGHAQDREGRTVALPVQVYQVHAEEMDSSFSNPARYYLSHRTFGSTVDLQGEASGDPLSMLARIISENRADLHRTMDNIADITGKINRGEGTLGALVNDSKLHNDAATLLDDAQVVVQDMRESLEDTREQAPVNSFIRAALTVF